MVVHSTWYGQQAQIFKLLTHPVRLEILGILRQGEQCVCHLETHLGYRQAYISQQLKVLKSSGLIEEERHGRNIYYRIKNKKIYHLLDSIQSMSQKKPVQSPTVTKECPCPKCNS